MIIRLISWIVLITFIGYQFQLIKVKKNIDLKKLRKKQQDIISQKLSEGSTNKTAEKEAVSEINIQNNLSEPSIKSIDDRINNPPTLKEMEEEKEEFKNADIRDHGGGTFSAHYVKDIDEIENIYQRKGEQENIKRPIDDINTKTNMNTKRFYDIPQRNHLEMSNDNDILDARINSVNTDIEIINKRKLIHELDNEIFTKEFKQYINKEAKEYVDELLNYETADRWIETRPRGGTIQSQGYEDSEGNEEETEYREDTYLNRGKTFLDIIGVSNISQVKEDNVGVYRRVAKHEITQPKIDIFNRTINGLLKKINNNDALKIKGGYDVIDPRDFIIVSKRIRYIMLNRNNVEEYLMRGEFVIYREGKNNGKHINVEMLVNGNTVWVIEMNVIGMTTEDKFYMLTASNEFTTNDDRETLLRRYGDNKVNYKYERRYVITHNPREAEVSQMSDNEKFYLLRKQRRDLSLDRGFVHAN